MQIHYKILVCSYDFDELKKKNCVDKNEDDQRNKEHNMHACISCYYNYYVDLCLGKYLVRLIILYAHSFLC